jgi:uncharacterized integral membrane protein
MSDLTPDQPLTLYDHLSVVLYRTGLAMAGGGVVAGCLLAWLDGDIVAGVGGGHKAATFLLLGTAAGISLGVWFLHLYAAKIRRGLRWVWGAAVAGLVIAIVIGGNPVAFYFDHWYGVIAGGLWVACYAMLCVKEGFCFRLYEGYAFAAVAPVVILAHLLGLGSVTARLAGWTLLAGLAALFTVRKLPQPLYYDIGDKAKYM